MAAVNKVANYEKKRGILTDDARQDAEKMLDDVSKYIEKKMFPWYDVVRKSVATKLFSAHRQEIQDTIINQSEYIMESAAKLVNNPTIPTESLSDGYIAISGYEKLYKTDHPQFSKIIKLAKDVFAESVEYTKPLITADVSEMNNYEQLFTAAYHDESLAKRYVQEIASLGRKMIEVTENDKSVLNTPVGGPELLQILKAQLDSTEAYKLGKIDKMFSCHSKQKEKSLCLTGKCL